MRSIAVLGAILFTTNVIVADDATLLAKQKQTAEKNFESIQTGTRNRSETAHFFVVGTIPEARLKALAATLEKTHTIAVKGLQFSDNDPSWKGKLAVLVLNDLPSYRSYARQITKRSPAPDETSSIDVRGETPSMGVNVGAFKEPAALDAALQQRLSTALIQVRAKTDKLPDWLIAGFVKATAAQGTPLATRKRQIIKLGLPATAAWSNDISVETRNQVAASVVEYLIYAKTIKPGEFLAAFRPETDLLDIEIPLTTVLEKVGLTPEKLDAGWRQWLAKP